jgi:acyl-CoA oxidase
MAHPKKQIFPLSLTPAPITFPPLVPFILIMPATPAAAAAAARPTAAAGSSESLLSPPSTTPLSADRRSGASRGPLGLRALFAGGLPVADRRDALAALYYADPVVSSTPKLLAPFLPRTQQYLRALTLVRRLTELRRAHSLSPDDFRTLVEVAAEATPLTVHETVYAPAVAGQADAAQLPLVADPARTWAHLGAYAQTELAHGSNVRGIETTATLVRDGPNPRTHSHFLLHTPTPTATKWWVGGLGKTATHAIVVARLVVNETDHGPHPFLVPIRDPATFLPLPGIDVGDIGPKVGFAPVDNGFIRFRNVRVPLSGLLSRFSRVKLWGSEAVYEAPAHPQAAYGGMLSARSAIVRAEYLTLGMGVTIATRYSAVRRQFAGGGGGGLGEGGGGAAQETAVLDYYSQQARLLPLVAHCYALRAVSVWLTEHFAAAAAAVGAGDTSRLADLHALSSALKVGVTEAVAKGLEDARRCCGGHGYSQACGIPRLAQAQVHLVTAEGDNHLLSQQVARYLLKARAGLVGGGTDSDSSSSSSSSAGAAFSHVDYLYPSASATPAPLPAHPIAWYADSCRPVLDALGLAVVRILDRMRARLEGAASAEAAAARGRDGDKDDGATARATARAWDASLLDAWAVTHAHAARTVLALFARFVEDVGRTHTHPTLAGVPAADAAAALRSLSTLLALQAVTALQAHALPTLLECGDATSAHARAAADESVRLCREVRQFAVTAVDAFGFHDDALGSALGRADGRVYEALLEWVRHEPLNATKGSPAAADLRAIVRLGHEELDRQRERAQAALAAAAGGGKPRL